MSIKSKVLATAATLTLVGGVGTAGVLGTAGAANAATPSCGVACVDIFSQTFGHHGEPNFLLDVYQQKIRIGQPIILFRASNTDRAEDFSLELNGTVADFFAAGMVTSAFALHFGCIAGVNFPNCTNAFPVTVPVTVGLGKTLPDGSTCTESNPLFNSSTEDADSDNLNSSGVPILPDADTAAETCTGTQVITVSDDAAFEIEYSPDGVLSGLCVGVASTAVQGEGVTLQQCGASSKTVWAVDETDRLSFLTVNSAPLINGSDTNFSHPFVLTYPLSGFPTDKPRPQLQVDNLTGFTNPPGSPLPIFNTVNDNQMWGMDFGPFVFPVV